ncbi:MAG: pyruvate synthase [Omnitrophica bacterium RIFCSPHIGHO2_02_FULL_63_14]|nr:MAG: pyruvate synthase [Omnitrophica bacterium RIFCSPHIGHO2_02_FULL_63_14]
MAKEPKVTVKTEKPLDKARGKRLVFKSGNELAALAASQINYHLMGYYPITPSTEVAEILSKMKADGKHDIVMVPSEGEHSAAGICYGAATGGGRVLNVTSSQGLLYALEQLPVQSGTRFPMVLNLAARAINGPLNIRCDHSDLYFALNTGWIILLAKDPQAVYDMNILAVRIGEDPKLRLPVMVVYDGFFTSHQKRQVQVLEDAEVKRFVGELKAPVTALDPANPVTIGPYMNDPDLINNKYQMKLAFDAARAVIPDCFKKFAALSGRRYSPVEPYKLEDAEAALVLLNSAAETAKEAVDRLRAKGRKVGVLSLSVLRPFPADEIRGALKPIKAVLIGDRADSYGADGGNLSLEVRAALKDDPANRTRCLSRVYGLGGKDFTIGDAEKLFEQAFTALKDPLSVPAFDYYGQTPGDPAHAADSNGFQTAPKLTLEEVSHHHAKVTPDPVTGRLHVELDPLWKIALTPHRIAPGHGACPGCGAFSIFKQFFRILDGNVVVLYQTGCAMVVTTGYPTTAHRITYLHNLFQNGGATLSGLVEMYHERVRRGELPGTDDPTFVMVSGDGGMDIGMGAALGAAFRNHRMILLEYDNEGYMNTGSQLSYSTPMAHQTSTSPVGTKSSGKAFHHKDTPQVFAAAGIPYVFTAVEGYPEDLMKKAAKAQWYARNHGFVYGKVLSHCPLNWLAPDDSVEENLQAAVDSCFFPLYEVELGKTVITYDPEALGRRRPLKDWFALMGKTRHLMAPEAEKLVAELEAENQKRWARLKTRHAHPEL